MGATAPPGVSSPASQGGATAAAHSVRTEEEWTELVVALQDMKVANAELKRLNAELQQKLRESLQPRAPQRSHRSTSMGGSPCQEPPLGRPQEGVRPRSIASSAPHQAREVNCRVDQYNQVLPERSELQRLWLTFLKGDSRLFSLTFNCFDNKYCRLAFTSKSNVPHSVQTVCVWTVPNPGSVFPNTVLLFPPHAALLLGLCCIVFWMKSAL